MAWLCLATGWLGCAREAATSRVVSGRILAGPLIDAEAYDAYALAAIYEERGDDGLALLYYERALEADGASSRSELWTRVGALRCRLGREAATLAFQRALAADPGYAPAYRERSRCSLRRRALQAALADVKHGAELDPDDEATSLLAAEIFERTGSQQEAGSWLLGFVLRHPRALNAWRALERYGLDHGRQDLVWIAQEALAEFVHVELPPRSSRLLRSIDRALGSGGLEQARFLAQRHGLSAEDLARLALELGYPKLAAAQAELVLRADPQRTDMLVVLLTALDQPIGAPAFREALLAAQVRGRPSPATAEMFSRLLELRVGPEAARAFREALESPSDEAARLPGEVTPAGGAEQITQPERGR